jgi:long-chain acyl-CoA synthetase
VSYAQLLAAAGEVARLLAAFELPRGAVVALILPNTCEFPAAYYGVQLAGCVALPLSPTADRSRLAERLRDQHVGVVLLGPAISGPAVEAAAIAEIPLLRIDADIFTDEAPQPEWPDVDVNVDVDEVAVLAYSTAGYDGAAAAELTHAALARAAGTMASTVLRLSAADTLLSSFPLLSPLGQTCGLNAVVATQACLVIAPSYEPDDILRTISEHHVTVLSLLPALLPGLLRAVESDGTDVSSVRTILCASGASLLPRQRERLESAFGCEVLESYGPIEASALACANLPGGEHRAGSVGTSVDGVRVQVHRGGREIPPGATGELVIQGTHTMLGYRHQPRATQHALRDGWLHTGIDARMDSDGFVYLLDGGWIGRVKAPRAGRENVLRRTWRKMRPAADS